MRASLETIPLKKLSSRYPTKSNHWRVLHSICIPVIAAGYCNAEHVITMKMMLKTFIYGVTQLLDELMCRVRPLNLVYTTRRVPRRAQYAIVVCVWQKLCFWDVLYSLHVLVLYFVMAPDKCDNILMVMTFLLL